MPEEFLSDAERIANRGKFFRRVHGDAVEYDDAASRERADLLHDIFERLIAQEKARRRRRVRWTAWAASAIAAACSGGVELIIHLLSKGKHS